MASQPKKRYSPEEYLAFERSSETKHEYFNGEIFAMGGASFRHVLIVTNLVTGLWSKLQQSPYRVSSADLRVRVAPTGLYTYPDVVVICDVPEFSDEKKDTLLNPVLIIEVLSDSTKDYDRGGKFEQYRTIESFMEYLLVAQDRPHVEHYIRQRDGSWVLYETNRLEDTIQLKSVPLFTPVVRHLRQDRFFRQLTVVRSLVACSSRRSPPNSLRLSLMNVCIPVRAIG